MHINGKVLPWYDTCISSSVIYTPILYMYKIVRSYISTIACIEEHVEIITYIFI